MNPPETQDRRRRGRPPQPGGAGPRRGDDTPTQARLLALRVLERVDRGSAYADIALHAGLDQSRLGPRDRALATELVYGSLRWRGRLDFLLARVTDRGLDRIEPRVLGVLRLGAYQIVFCDNVPDAVAVSESVRLARAGGLERAAGLVNASLRRLSREHETIALPTLEEDAVAHLTHALSLPGWLAGRWIARFGAEEAAALALAMNQVPPRTIRVNRRRTDRDTLLAELRERFPEAAPVRFASDGIALGSHGDAARDPAFLDGRFTIQDEASQVVVDLLDPQPGERILDACAAPGAKATAIAERVGDDGEVVAVDRNRRRLGLLDRDARRLDLSNLPTVEADSTHPLPPPIAQDGFDRILVDAPCSGLGTLRRNPDARWRIRPEALPALAAIQRAILRSTATLLRPGGTLVYSTCTLAPEENENLVDAFLADADANPHRLAPIGPGRMLERLRPLADGHAVLRCLPHLHNTDGFFAVRLERPT